jgi:hypothetical protein
MYFEFNKTIKNELAALKKNAYLIKKIPVFLPKGDQINTIEISESGKNQGIKILIDPRNLDPISGNMLATFSTFLNTEERDAFITKLPKNIAPTIVEELEKNPPIASDHINNNYCEKSKNFSF